MIENNKNSKVADNQVLFRVNEHGIAFVTLNNPDKHNAFDDILIRHLTRIFQEISEAKHIRVMVLSAKGKNFCAGADLGWMKRIASYSYDENLADANALAKMFHTLNTIPVPIIAKVQGAAFGGGVGLVSCCDIILANETASFCLSEVKLGLIPATISPYVINAIGMKASRRYFLTAERFSAGKAQQIGLVDEITTIENLDDETNNMINILLQNGPQALRHAKDLIFSVANQPIDNHLMLDTSDRIASIRSSKEGQEGLSAFIDKRPADWLTQ